MASSKGIIYHILKFPGLAMLKSFEAMIRWTSPDPPFHAPEKFPWIPEIEAEYPSIRTELLELLKSKHSIPNLQDIFVEQEQLTEGEDWKSHMMYMYGFRIDRNCDLCPETEAALKKIPGMRTAMFSILAPGKHIPPHTGPFKGVLRLHLGLVIPADAKKCGIKVGGVTRHWEEGECLILDDTQMHEAWNDSGEYRAILFVDFKRNLPWPVSWMSELLYQMMRRSPFVKNVVKSLGSA